MTQYQEPIQTPPLKSKAFMSLFEQVVAHLNSNGIGATIGARMERGAFFTKESGSDLVSGFPTPQRIS